MSRHASEASLEADCRAGNPTALARAERYLASAQAYTRGRAAEMLAVAPPDCLAPLVDAVFAVGFPTADWWRVVALYAEEHGELPHGKPSPRRLEALMWTPADRDPDALYQVLRLLAAVKLPGTRRFAEALFEHPDDEIALRAAHLYDDCEPGELPERALRRLRGIRGADAIHALVLRFRYGDERAAEALVAAIPRSGPYAFHALDALEAQGDDSVIPALRRLYRPRLLPTPLASRAAATAALLGDPDALERLRALTRSRRLPVRSVAAAELARTGTREDIHYVADLVGGDADPAFASVVVAELWRRDTTATREIVREALDSESAEVRAAACESVAEWPPDPKFTEAVELLTAFDPDADVREAASGALAAVSPGASPLDSGSGVHVATPDDGDPEDASAPPLSEPNT